MNGTLLFRRSASMVLTSSFLFVAACGVEMNGLFDGDAEADGAAPGGDAGLDTSFSDRAPDSRVDTGIDTSSVDGSSNDRSTTDGSPEDRGDGTTNPPTDTGSSSDATLDATADRRDASDADDDGTLADGTSSDGPRDVGTDPAQDTSVGDVTVDPKVDTAGDVTVDIVADTRPDVPRDTTDAPPGTCGGGCNTFANISPTVTRTVDPGSPPTMTGGTLVDGTYVVTSVVQYNNDNSMYSLAETSVIGGNMDAWVSETNGQAPVRYTTIFTTTNNQLAFSFCCPAAGNLTILYTTDGTTISHIDPANPNRVITYTRQ